TGTTGGSKTAPPNGHPCCLFIFPTQEEPPERSRSWFAHCNTSKQSASWSTSSTTWSDPHHGSGYPGSATVRGGQGDPALQTRQRRAFVQSRRPWPGHGS